MSHPISCAVMLLLAGRQTPPAPPKPAVHALRLSSGRTIALQPGYTVPAITRSPHGRYGVLVPDLDRYNWDAEQNRLIDLKTGRILAVIHAHAGALEANHVQIERPNWSRDDSLLLWRVAGKWMPTALNLLTIRNGRVVQQLNILDAAQRAIMTRTRSASPRRYAAAVSENRGSGAAFPDGLTIPVEVDIDPGKPLRLPLQVSVTLTSNPKGIEDFPRAAQLDSELRAVVAKDGVFRVTHFALVRARRNGENDSP